MSTTFLTAPLIEQLVEVLAKEQQGLEAFLAVLERERHAIKALSADGMAAATSAKLTLLETLGAIERQRAEVIAQLAREWSVEADQLTLRAIAERVEAREAGALLRMRDTLNRALAELGDANEFNGMVIAHSLACFEGGLSAGRVNPATPLYSAAGLLQMVQGPGEPTLARKG
ncbi:MAG: flagellar protein FlgN [Nitrospirota bacterium]